MPRTSKGARLWLRPARRKGRRLIANAVWIIIDGSRHVATGCLKDQAGEAEKKLAAYIADKYRPTRLAKDIDQIDVADVLSIYLDDCGPPITDQPKLERCIGRLNDYWGGKMLSEVTAAECRAYVQSRGKIGGARNDLETLRAAINHHAKESLHYGTVRVTLPPKGPPKGSMADARRGRRAYLGLLALPRAPDRAPRPSKGPADRHRQTAIAAFGPVHPDWAVYWYSRQRDCVGLAVPRCRPFVRRP